MCATILLSCRVAMMTDRDLRCLCGATDCPTCGPLQGYGPDDEDEDDAFERLKADEVDNETDHKADS